MEAGPRGSRKKLVIGVRLALLHPEWNISCAHCEKWWKKADGSYQFRRPLQLQIVAERPKGCPTPCTTCPKVPAGVRMAATTWQEARHAAVEVSEQTRQTLEFFKRCRATDRFPDDPLVDWYSVIIRDVWDEADTLPLVRIGDKLQRLIEANGRRK